MNKYYIKSGTLHVVILGEDERDAIVKAVELATNGENRADVILDDHFYANEQGFDSISEKDFRMNTEEVIIDLLDWGWEDFN
jgi:hypothetical protein|tara:strand:+ start:851 stop:1096 length:246 start_codon:yes stop_codon:yes gene_type:complete